MRSIVDGYGRPFSGLRVSITQKCNLLCPHCHKEGQIQSAEEMTPDEIGRISSIAASLGSSKVKITGGEPLMREDICEIVSAIRPYVREISMTTNGVLLSSVAEKLKRAGLDRVNMSVHSLSGSNLERISGMNYLDDFERGLKAAESAELKPIKLNMVVLKGINEGEIWEMARYASSHGAILQLIELASDKSRCNEEFFLNHHYSLNELEAYLAANSSGITYNELHRRGRYTLEKDGMKMVIELVRSMHNSEFCANCGRLRLSSDGKLKGCLFDKQNQFDLLGPLRNGNSSDEIREIFMKTISRRMPYWR